MFTERPRWSVVGHDVCNAVRDFFSNGCILKEINHTFLALIPKVSTPLKVNDYRLISCCNVIYKCISKILSNRIIEGIKEVVSDNQATFVPGRRISDIQHGYSEEELVTFIQELGYSGKCNMLSAIYTDQMHQP
ncbi:methylenetetrahydrofolate reductase 1, partial [Tanacetum coccineum]